MNLVAGKLFAAMHSVDADGLIQFVFPAERLPSHTQVHRSLQPSIRLGNVSRCLPDPDSTCSDLVCKASHIYLVAYAQMLLASDAGRRVLNSWPQYQGCVVLDNLGRPHVHLDVFRCRWTELLPFIDAGHSPNSRP